MKTILKLRLAELLQAMARDFRILAPVKSEAVNRFTPWQEGLTVNLEENTVLPPKDIFFPQTEKMYKFKVKGSSVNIEEFAEDEQKQVIFGIRSCDMQSIDCLDKVFLTKGYEDLFYKTKREKTLLVALACNRPQDTCFCESMGLNPLAAPGAHVQAYDLGDALGLVANTPEGEELLAKHDRLFTGQNAVPPKVEGFNLKAGVAGIPEKLAQMFEHPIWDEVSQTCLGCGVCAYLCPTCHCFDISGNVKGGEGYKFRCWDCCMFSEYTRMAGGHNPRPSKKERVRNRFMHKLCYFQERYGQLLCTGCGRCIAKCPVGMDITAIIEKIKEAEI